MNKRKMKKHRREIALKNKLEIANRRANELYDHQNFVAASNRLLRNELDMAKSKFETYLEKSQTLNRKLQDERGEVRRLKKNLEITEKESLKRHNDCIVLRNENVLLRGEINRLKTELQKANRSVVEKLVDWWKCR